MVREAPVRDVRVRRRCTERREEAGIRVNWCCSGLDELACSFFRRALITAGAVSICGTTGSSGPPSSLHGLRRRTRETRPCPRILPELPISSGCACIGRRALASISFSMLTRRVKMQSERLWRRAIILPWFKRTASCSSPVCTNQARSVMISVE